MVVIKITGGLGNQMFQYAYGRALELKGKQVIFDTSFFYGHRVETDTQRVFKLDKFRLLSQAEFSPKSYAVLDFIRKLKRKIGFKIYTDYPSEKNFIGAEESIKREFVLKNDFSKKAQEILKQIIITNAVSLHVRRGDYVLDKKTNAHHGVCDLDYYYSAIKIIKEKVGNPTFFIFSDDINWVKDNFKDEKMIFVSSNEIDDVEDMMLMSRCEHHIIANSSFSWWGAWLGQNPEKLVIAPKKWLNIKKTGTNDIIPKSWLKI